MKIIYIDTESEIKAIENILIERESVLRMEEIEKNRLINAHEKESQVLDIINSFFQNYYHYILLI